VSFLLLLCCFGRGGGLLFCSLELDCFAKSPIYLHTFNLSIHTFIRTNKCINCGIKFAEYHCPKCNIWMALGKRPFHCEECGKFNIVCLYTVVIGWGVSRCTLLWM